jgi:tRNA(Ile)-lysidine synthase TilS/MesJ
LDAPDIYRPLVRYTKQDVIEYAQHHKLEWREDPTNSDTKYLRNQLRQQLKAMSLDDKLQIAALVTKQRDLKKQIEKESQQLVDSTYNTYNFSRYFLINIQKAEALECLRAIVGSKLTHPQLAKLLHAIKTMSLGKRYEAGNGVLVDFTTRNFSVELLK